MKEENGILWKIEEGILTIQKSETGNGSIPVKPITYGTTTYEDDGYERNTSIFEGAFEKPWTIEEQDSVIEIMIEEKITTIPFGTFSNFKNCKKIGLPNTVESIGKWAFRGCENLEEINLPEGIIFIEDETFLGCKNLKDIKLPNSITRIGNKAFSFCSRLKKIEFPENLEFIGEGAFSFCKELETITIPDSVNHIGREAFYFCDKLKKAYLPKEKIEDFQNAFKRYGYHNGKFNNYGTQLIPKGKSFLSKIFKK